MEHVNLRKRTRDEDEEELGELRAVAKVSLITRSFPDINLAHYRTETKESALSRRPNDPAQHHLLPVDPQRSETDSTVRPPDTHRIGGRCQRTSFIRGTKSSLRHTTQDQVILVPI